MNKRAEEIRVRLAELREKESEIMTLPTPLAASLWQPILREWARLSEELETIAQMTEEEYSAHVEEKRRKKEKSRRRVKFKPMFCIVGDVKDDDEKSLFYGAYCSGTESYKLDYI